MKKISSMNEFKSGGYYLACFDKRNISKTNTEWWIKQFKNDGNRYFAFFVKRFCLYEKILFRKNFGFEKEALREERGNYYVTIKSFVDRLSHGKNFLGWVYYSLNEYEVKKLKDSLFMSAL